MSNAERFSPINYRGGVPFDGTNDVPQQPNRPGILQVIGGVDASGNVQPIMLSGAIGAGGVIVDDDAILAALAAVLTVKTTVISAGNVLVATANPGTNYATFGAQVCTRLIIVNTSGVTIEVMQGGVGVALPIPNNAAFTFEGITNANQLSVRRVDLSNVPVNVHGRYEAL